MVSLLYPVERNLKAVATALNKPVRCASWLPWLLCASPCMSRGPFLEMRAPPMHDALTACMSHVLSSQSIPS
jgi:hypothetical protein